MAVKRTFPKDLLLELLDGEADGHVVVSDDIIDTSRWSVFHTLIFVAPDGTFWTVGYSHGATEMQDEYPFDHQGDEIECTQVQPVEKTVTVYEAVK